MGQKVQHLREWSHVARRAVLQGAVLKSASRIYWDVSGNGRLNCTSPVYREYMGADAIGYDLRNNRTQGRKNTRVIELDTRCRRCPPCLEWRKLLWRGRARIEIAQASRTWFGTLTLSPDQQVKAKLRAMIRLHKSGTEWEQLTREEQFAERVAMISPEITKWIKRVRKQSSVKTRQQARKSDGCTATVGARCRCHPLSQFNVTLRYLQVVEEHTGGGAHHGLPHFHFLIHEVNENRPVRHSVLTDKWTLGHTDFQLIPSPDEGGNRFANYVTKYLTKSILCRARASLKYGRTSEQLSPISKHRQKPF